MQFVERSVADPAREAEGMRRLVQAISREMWLLYGANGRLDWIRVERHLRRIVERARRDVRGSRAVPVFAAAHPPTHLARRRRRPKRGWAQGDRR